MLYSKYKSQENEVYPTCAYLERTFLLFSFYSPKLVPLAYLSYENMTINYHLIYFSLYCLTTASTIPIHDITLHLLRLEYSSAPSPGGCLAISFLKSSRVKAQVHNENLPQFGGPNGLRSKRQFRS